MKGAFYFIILIIVIAVWGCGSTKSKTSRITEYSDESMLVDYGEYIYEREDCKKCHTQLISEANENTFSLDDYGGLRSTAWTYLFLLEPRYLIPGCSMPSYKYLEKKELDKDILRQILSKRKITKSELEKNWRELNQATLDYMNGFKDDINLEESKVSALVPLVAYLQQLPRSPEKRYLDSLENIKHRKEMLAIEFLYKKSDSIISATLNDPSSIENGKQLFNVNCSVCHGKSAQGEIGPNLTDDYWIYGGDNENIIRTIINGSPNGMPSHKYKFTPKVVGQVASYVISLKGSNPANPKAPQGTKEK